MTGLNSSLKPAAGMTPLQSARFEQDRSVEREAQGRVAALIVSLYQQKMTYGEFAQKRYELERNAAITQIRYREARLLVDGEQQLRAQQLAQQEFQNSVQAFSAYTQSVNARRPQTMRLSCTSRRSGNFTSTDCY